MILSLQEEYVIGLMREAVPFEVIEIHKDKLGVADSYLIKRSRKIFVSELEVRAVK